VHRRYLARLSVLLDRVDIHATLPAVWPATGSANQSWPTELPGEASATVAARVAQARAAAAARWSGQSWQANGEATSRALQASLSGVPAKRFAPLRERIAAGGLSTRGGVRVLRLAWTIADLAGHAHPTADDVAEALWLRTGQQVA
jgi:magnesium chelatase family protein